MSGDNEISAMKLYCPECNETRTSPFGFVAAIRLMVHGMREHGGFPVDRRGDDR